MKVPLKRKYLKNFIKKNKYINLYHELAPEWGHINKELHACVNFFDAFLEYSKKDDASGTFLCVGYVYTME